MCGIHAIVDRYGHITETVVQQMLAATRHRGPDAQGLKKCVHPCQSVWLASNRLKISDLRDVANQPMNVPGGRYSLVFNGAIYNHAALRRRFLDDVSFSTTSDTETLLHLLIRLGPEALPHLNGMFAFAFYDHAAGRLLLARDQWGMKPLYWHENEEVLVVSSELKGLLASGKVPQRPNVGQIPHYLLYKFARKPATFYQDVFELEPGCFAESRPGTRLHVSPFAPDAPGQGAGASGAALAQAMKAATQHHLQADVAAGLFLSGGVDSTLLLAAAYAGGVRKLPVFTIAYPDADAPHATQDHAFARAAADGYQAQFHTALVSAVLLEQFPNWMETVDQPVADGAAWLTYVLAEEARRHVGIILSGAGADELFAGYNRHQAFHAYLKWHCIGKRLVPMLSAAKTLTGGAGWQKVLRDLRASPAQTFAGFSSSGHMAGAGQDEARKEAERDFEASLPASGSFMERNLAAALWFDQKRYLASDVLAITDRMTMQHGIEARMPYLDAEIALIARAIPPAQLLRHGGKWPLKQVLRQWGGAAFANRRKQGFGMPMGPWLCTPHGRAVTETLSRRQSLIFEAVPYAEVQALVEAHRYKGGHAQEVWALAVLAAWLEKAF